MILLVGDIQGCDGALQALLELSGFSPSRDRLVLLGDLVNRGPRSLTVLQRLMAMGDAATALLGNHDLHLLSVANGVQAMRRGDSLDEILASPQRAACIDWLRHQRLACRVEGWLCVHAGVPPAWSADDTLRHAAELETLLRSDALATFLPLMYGNKPRRWDEALEGPDRWRHIVNALTRIRFCTADGKLDLETKEGAGATPEGHWPWFDVPGRRSADTPVAFGHWSTMGLVDRENLLGLDTGCVWGGRLTAARVDGGRRELFQVACPQSRRPGDD